MKKRRGTILMVVIGALLCIVIVGVGATAWFFVSVFDSTQTDDVSATRGFDEVTRRFSGSQPVLEIRNDDAVLTRTPPERATGDLQRVQVLAWDPDDKRLSRVTVPWWLIRLKEGPIDITSEVGAGVTRTRLRITVDEIERYGPALLIDHTEPDGSRVVVWTE